MTACLHFVNVDMKQGYVRNVLWKEWSRGGRQTSEGPLDNEPTEDRSSKSESGPEEIDNEPIEDSAPDSESGSSVDSISSLAVAGGSSVDSLPSSAVAGG